MLWRAGGFFWNMIMVSTAALLLLSYFVASYHHVPRDDKTLPGGR